MKPGYRLLRRILGEAILSGALNRRERALAKEMYSEMARDYPIHEEWEPAGKPSPQAKLPMGTSVFEPATGKGILP